MPLDLPPATKCFIDTNVVYYAFVETPPLTPHCRDLLRRLQRGEITGYTSIPVLADAIHKTMLAQASVRWTRGGPTS